MGHLKYSEYFNNTTIIIMSLICMTDSSSISKAVSISEISLIVIFRSKIKYDM